MNSGSAHVALVFFSRLSLSESIPMSVFAMSSDAQGGTPSLLEWGTDVLTWGRPNYLGSEISRYQESCMWPEIRA